MLQTPATEEIAPSLQDSYSGSMVGEEVILVDNGVMVVVEVTDPLSGTVTETAALTSPPRETNLEVGDTVEFSHEHIHGIRSNA